jgi:hypothetical protein
MRVTLEQRETSAVAQNGGQFFRGHGFPRRIANGVSSPARRHLVDFDQGPRAPIRAGLQQ